MNESTKEDHVTKPNPPDMETTKETKPRQSILFLHVQCEEKKESETNKMENKF